MKKINNNSNNKKSCCLGVNQECTKAEPGTTQNLRKHKSPQQLKTLRSNNFAEQVYSALRKVPKGKITTYKDLANACGTNAFRAVGTALKNNPYAPKVPCHRVISSNGSIGGFMGETSGSAIQKKIKLLQKEGVRTQNNKVINFENKRYKF